jgi:hypothetical protein
MKLIYWDYTPRWVPFAAAAMIVIGVWIGGVWDNFEFATTTRFAVGLACVLFVLIFFQGRYFWKGQVDKITGDGEYFEAVTSIWVGRGKRIAFGPHEATEWTAKPSSSRKEGEPEKLSTVSFKVKGQTLEMSFLNPKVIDLEALSAMNPGYFAKLKADYPALASVG